MYKNIPPYLSFNNNQLHYLGINLAELTKKYGSPLEVAYTDMINLKVKYMQDLFASVIQKEKYRGDYLFAYASKANYYSEVISTALNHIDLLETSSGYDLDIVEKLFLDRLLPKEYTVICNGFKKGYYYEKMVKLRKLGLNIIPVIENLDEAEMFLQQKTPFNVGMRINIDEQKSKSMFDVKRAGSKVDTRFGLYFEDMMKTARRINASEHLKFKLFHFHIGGTIYDIGKYIKFLGYILDKNYCPLKKICSELEYLDIGGGFPTQYSMEFKFDYPKLASEIVKTVKKYADKHRVTHPRIVAEHGRYTVADHSFFLYDIDVIKKSEQNSYWYLINSSLMNFLPDSWALGQDFVVLPLNLAGNKLVKVKLGGLTCDPDDTYYKQEKKNFLYLPEVKPGEHLQIGVFGVGAYQEMIAGVGGVHHCMIPEGNELIITKKGDHLHFNNISNQQTPKQLLETLGYSNTHSLVQYLNKYDIELLEHTGHLEDYYAKLPLDFPPEEIFPFEKLNKAYLAKDYQVMLLKKDGTVVGYAFVALLKKTQIALMSYLCIFKDYRDQGLGHIFVNELKSYYAGYEALLVEAEKPEEGASDSLKQRRINFYQDLDFVIQPFDYKSKAVGSDGFIDFLLLACNTRTSSAISFKEAEMKAILEEGYGLLYGSDASGEYQLKR